MKDASSLLTSPLLERIEAANQWVECGQQYSNDVTVTIEACSTRLELQELSLVFARSLSAQRERMIKSRSGMTMTSVISDCGALLIERGYASIAVELLDQGRAMVFSHLSRYRTALDDLACSTDPHAKQLAEQYLGCRKKLPMHTHFAHFGL